MVRRQASESTWEPWKLQSREEPKQACASEGHWLKYPWWPHKRLRCIWVRKLVSHFVRFPRELPAAPSRRSPELCGPRVDCSMSNSFSDKETQAPGR